MKEKGNFHFVLEMSSCWVSPTCLLINLINTVSSQGGKRRLLYTVGLKWMPKVCMPLHLTPNR